MAKKYKVIALSVKGIGSRIYASGDIVTEDMFNEEHPDILVSKGFLAPYSADVEVPNPNPVGNVDEATLAAAKAAEEAEIAAKKEAEEAEAKAIAEIEAAKAAEEAAAKAAEEGNSNTDSKKSGKKK